MAHSFLVLVLATFLSHLAVAPDVAPLDSAPALSLVDGESLPGTNAGGDILAAASGQLTQNTKNNAVDAVAAAMAEANRYAAHMRKENAPPAAPAAPADTAMAVAMAAQRNEEHQMHEQEELQETAEQAEEASGGQASKGQAAVPADPSAAGAAVLVGVAAQADTLNANQQTITRGGVSVTPGQLKSDGQGSTPGNTISADKPIIDPEELAAEAEAKMRMDAAMLDVQQSRISRNQAAVIEANETRNEALADVKRANDEAMKEVNDPLWYTRDGNGPNPNKTYADYGKQMNLTSIHHDDRVVAKRYGDVSRIDAGLESSYPTTPRNASMNASSLLETTQLAESESAVLVETESDSDY